MSAILIQGVISSLILVGLYSQSSLVNTTIFLQGGLSTVWLLSGFFFLIPVVIARKKYADRYENETFWRIPGGMVGVWITVIGGTLGTIGGVWYSFAKSWLTSAGVGGAEVDEVGRQHQCRDVRTRAGGLHLRPPLGATRSRRKMPWPISRCSTSPPTTRPQPRRIPQMTMDSTLVPAESTDATSRYPLDPLTGAEIEAAAAVITESDYATPTLKFVMIQLAEPAKTAALSFVDATEVPRRRS